MSDDKKDIRHSIGKFEIGFGTLVFVYATLSPMLGRFFPVLEPDMLFGLWSVLLLALGPILVLGGASLMKHWRWPFVAHIPLVLWAGATWYLFT